MRNYKKEYSNYHSKPQQKKKRASRNTARAKMLKVGKVTKGDKKEVKSKVKIETSKFLKNSISSNKFNIIPKQ